jgi:hypothetical protein
MKRKFLFTLALIPLWSHAHEANLGTIVATVGPYIYQTHHMTTPREADPYNLGFSIIAEGDIDYNGGIEVSLSYLQKTYPRKDGELYNIEKTKRIYVNTGYRHWFTKDYSAGVSFFSAYSMGGSTIIRSDYPLAVRPASSAKDVAEYGFEFSVQAEPWRNERWAALIDARYSYSVTNKTNEDGNHFGLIIGAKYLIQDLTKGIHPK